MLIAEVQQIAAGSDFDGTLPTSNTHVFNGVKEFKPHTAGGKFVCQVESDEDPTTYDRVRKVKDVRISFGGQSSWQVKVTDGTRSVLILSGTTETELLATDVNLELTPAEYLTVETTGASTAMHCTVTYEYARSAILGA